MADINSEEEVVVSMPPWRRGELQRVPVPLLGNKKQKHIFDPVTVQLGPYNYNRDRPSRFNLADQLKWKVLDMVCGDCDRDLLRSLVSERLPEIREFYSEAASKYFYSDEEQAELMLRDTCFVMCILMADSVKIGVFFKGIGAGGSIFTWRDLLMLENQIPLWLISLLSSCTYGCSHNLESQLFKFLLQLITCNIEETTTTTLSWRKDGELPLHLLDAVHQMLLPSSYEDFGPDSITGHEPPAQLFNNMFRSATDLKAKGIHLRPSSHFLNDIKFFSYSTHGQLHLPVFRISDTSRVLLSNLIAYELTMDEGIDLGIIHYVSLMKTLLQGAEDVELLREKGILYSLLSNEEVVSLFKEIDTCVAINPARLNNVKMRIEEHCKNKGKTWLAELINTYFRSPLTALALFTAAFILALTFLQTFYTINPRYANAAP